MFLNQSQHETIWLFETQFLNFLAQYRIQKCRVLRCIHAYTYSYSLTTTNKSSGWKCNKNDGCFMSKEIFRGGKLNIFKVYCLFSNYYYNSVYNFQWQWWPPHSNLRTNNNFTITTTIQPLTSNIRAPSSTFRDSHYLKTLT